MPAGWFSAGSHPQHYLIGADLTTSHRGACSGTVAARREQPEGFGTLMQQCLASAYCGQRLRLTGYLKAAGVTGWAGMWLRIDGPDGEKASLGFDNMQDRPITGTCDWTQHTIVLDVPNTSHALAFGVLLEGPGQVWIDDLRFDIVGTDIPVTGRTITISPQPVNLDFEQGA
jgi:hypothetical protein